MKLTIDGWHCQQFTACEFTRAVNDGNLTAAIDAWMDLNGCFIPEFSYSVGAGQADGEAEPGWIPETGDDWDGTDIVYDVDVTSGVHSLHIKDALRTAQMKLAYALPAAIAIGKTLRIKMKHASVSADTTANCFYAIQLNQGSDVGAHLLIAADGQVYHKNSDADQTATTGASDTGENLANGEVRYLWVNLIDKDTFKCKVTTSTTAPSVWSAVQTMPDDITTGWDTIRIYTPDANDDGGVLTDTIDEDFESGTVGNSIIGGQWSWVVGPAGTSSMKCATGKVGQLVANGGRSQVLYTFPTASANTPAAGVSVSVEIVGPQSGASNGIDVFIKQNATGPVYAAIFQTDGKIYDRDGAGTLTDTGATWSGGTTYTLKFEVVDDTHHKLYVDDVDKGSFSNWASTNGKVIDGWAMDTYNYATAGNYDTTVSIDDITGSWTSGTVYTAKTVEAYIYEIWSDQGFVTPADIRGRQVDLWQGAKHAWRGFIHGIESTTTAAGTTHARLKCYDEFYRCGQEDIKVSNLKHTTTVDTLNDNEVNMVDAVGDTSELFDLWCLVRHNAGTVKYDDDAGDYASLDSSAYTSGYSGGRLVDISVGGGAHTDTATRNNVFHMLTVSFSLNPTGDYGYLEYTMDRVAPSDRTPQSGKIVLHGKSSFTGGNLGQYEYAYMYAYNYVTGSWDNRGMIGQAPGANFGYLVEIPFTTGEFPLDAAHISDTADPGNWQCKIRIVITSSLASLYSIDCDWYIDYLRVHVTASKDVSYVPVEAPIDTIDDTTSIDINATPFAEQNAAVGDSVMIAKSIPAALMAALIMLSNVTVNVGEPFGCHPIDYRGDDGYSAFQRTCKACGIDFWLDVDEDGGGSVLHCGGDSVYWSARGIATSTEIHTVNGFGRDVTNDNRVTIDRTNQVGSYLNFPSARVAGTMEYFDTVYKLISVDLDTAPSRTLKTFEVYFWFKDDIGNVAFGQNMNIYLPGSSDASSGPYLYVHHQLVGGVQYYSLTVYGDVGNSATSTISIDAFKTGAIKCVIDYDEGTIVAYTRDVITDGGIKKLADTWTIVDDCDDCTVTTGAARALTFEDASGGAVDTAEMDMCIMRIDVTYEPVVHDGGTITPRGDITIEQKDDRVKSLTVIGGKDASGNELEYSVTVDPDGLGFNKVELQTSMTSIAELHRYADTFVENYESDKRSIRMQNYTVLDSEALVFHPGYTYTFTLDGVSYTEQLRRATCKASAEQPLAAVWDLEFGKAHTTGSEKLRRSGQAITSDIKELKRK